MDIIELSKPICQGDVALLTEIYTDAFDMAPTEDFLERLNDKKDLSLLIAREKDTVIGFKIGYTRFRGVFFSWLGAVGNNHRRKGIARALLQHQHALCADREYSVIQTEAAGNNRAMLLLNLQEGFEVYGVHMGRKGELTVQLQKVINGAKL